MAHCYIAFVNSATDRPVVQDIYPKAAGCRITLQSALRSSKSASIGPKVWVDTGTDGLHFPGVTQADNRLDSDYKSYIEQFSEYARIADTEFQRKPDLTVVSTFTRSILDRAVKAVPQAGWLSVPQLPYLGGSQRNKINRALAEATRKWKATSSYRGKFILPIILSRGGQTDRKMGRNPAVDLAYDCFTGSDAEGVWVVDSTLDDEAGVGSFESDRFPGIIRFQEELNAKISTGTTVAGPYWGLNLVLWARGLVRLPAIGAGKTYRYYISGGRHRLQKPGARIAIPPLKRLVVWSPDLRSWLEDVLRKLPKDEPARNDFAVLLRQFSKLGDAESARRQVASFYRGWIEELESVPPGSRALTLYQNFSSAYVLGRSLPSLPRRDKVREPARIAKQLMVNCL